MTKCYMVGEVTVTNPGPYAEYQQKVPALVEQYGGKYLVRVGKIHPKEGKLGISRMVIVEFESYEAAMRFYDSDDYAPLLKMRKEHTDSHVVFVEGYPGT
jgi:uncharacterized protein (DUF1330 family)